MIASSGPDFFIVGAPKCGTTSLDAYLRQHPEIYMAPKEPHYFGSDLGENWKRLGAGSRLTLVEYEALFADGVGATCRGEASVWYLRSRAAAREIREYNPDARIIAIVRNPVDMLASLHSQCVFDQIEDLEDFGEALAAESDRRAGRRIPPNNGPHPWRLFYREVARFHDQLERYFTAFGHDRVHVVIFDDLVNDPPATYRGVLEFLGVDANFVASFDVHNQNKRFRSRWLRQVLMKAQGQSSPARRLMHVTPPNTRRRAALRAAGELAMRLNTTTPRPSVDPGVRASLASELAPEVVRLSRLLERDLGDWISPGPEDQGAGFKAAAALRGSPS